MKKTILLASLAIATAVAAQNANAIDVKIRAGVASSTYDLDGDYLKATSTYTPLTIALTLATDDGWYVDWAGTAGSGTHDGWAKPVVNATICSGLCNANASPAEDFKRTDAALIAGKSFFNSNNGIAAAVYAGLKTGTTTLAAAKAGTNWQEETFQSSGLVFGGGASFPLAGGQAGSIGVNIGLGLMGATWKDNKNSSATASSAVGASFAVNYTYPFTPDFGVVVDLKGNSFSYNFAAPSSSPFVVNETVSSLGASLYAKF